MSDGEAGGNGVYHYGSGFPTSSYNGSNYWVDVVFAPSKVSPQAPSVVSVSPARGGSGVSSLSSVVVGFSGIVLPSSIGMTVTDPSGIAVAGSISYNSALNAATFTPAGPFGVSKTYSVTLSSATDLFGNPLTSPVTWTFTTASAPSDTLFSNTATPAVASSGDTSPIELGIAFQSSVPGYLSGIRFYKGPGNGGTHVAHLWTASGTLLASATFTAETASGWQQVNFAQPVAIASGTQYVASYYARKGLLGDLGLLLRFRAGGRAAVGGGEQRAVRLRGQRRLSHRNLTAGRTTGLTSSSTPVRSTRRHPPSPPNPPPQGPRMSSPDRSNIHRFR